MTYIDYLLTCLAEELSEATKEVLKCARFTPDHRYTEYQQTNVERAQLEMADVYAVAHLLLCEGVDVGLYIPTMMSPAMAHKFVAKKEATKTSYDLSLQIKGG